jgi:hypothetical protein
MDKIFEILASVAGLLIYWWLTSRKAKLPMPPAPKQQPSGDTASGPSYEDIYPDPMEDAPAPAPRKAASPKPSPQMTFEDLLEQYLNPKPPVPESAPHQPLVTNPYESMNQSVSVNTTEPAPKKTVKQYKSLKEDAAYEFAREEELRSRLKKMNRYRKLLKNKQTVRDAFVLKEVFDPKYF